MTYSEAVRYIMQQCDMHGLHHEVLSEFVQEVESAFNKNEELCRRGLPQEEYDYAAIANAALLEWDI